MRSIKDPAVFAVGAALALFLYFGEAASAAPGKVHKLRYAYIPNVNTAMLIIAQEKGIFKDLGLEVELIRFNSGPAQFAAINSGAVDVGEMSTNAFVIGKSQGMGSLSQVASKASVQLAI